ncbi:hypothetical protein SK128_024759 [Halocaridina rubra]|uniref:BPTI/Kunitz inhibitor domain-containing protein n=1 Tax=Halocaridina rubra TaxID=373956 RepID=A0AAN9A3R2_HALRR
MIFILESYQERNTLPVVFFLVLENAKLLFLVLIFQYYYFSQQSNMSPFPSTNGRTLFSWYYYNASMNVCDCYIFGGCDEAEGSYRNLEECHDKCNPSIKEEGPSCKFVYIENFHPVQPGHGRPASPPSTESGNTDQVHPTNQRPSTSSHAEGERPQLPGFQVNRRPNINNTHQNAFGHVPLPGSGIPVEINPFLPFDIRSFAVIPVENGRVTSTGNTRATGSTSPGHFVRPAENPMVSLNNGRVESSLSFEPSVPGLTKTTV